MSARSSPNTRVGNGGSGAKVGRCANTDAQRSRIAARPRVTSPRRPRGRTVDLASLRDRSLICLPRGAGIRSVFDAAASVAGGAIRPAIEASSPDAIIELVYSGMGVGILSESIAAADDRVVGVPIRDVDATAHLGLLWRSKTSAAATRSVDIARDAFAVGD